MGFLLTSTVISLALISHMIRLTQSTCLSSRPDVTLQGHEIVSFKTAELGECWRVCKEYGRCQSLNFFVKQQVCEINNRTIELASNDSVQTPYAAYFDNPYRVAVGTVKELPAVSCAEIMKSVGRVSGRYWFVDHARSSVPFMAYCNMTTVAVEDCNVGQCKNGGECTYFGAGKYLCACPIRWSGQNCEIKLSVCDSTPCRNGGTCIDQGDSYKCTCDQLFYGIHCEKECVHSAALGMQSMAITNSQITASSAYSGTHAPWFARLHRTFGGNSGGWSAQQGKTGDWIQVDFNSVKIVTAVATQGRSNAAQWVTSYAVSYSNNALGIGFTLYQGGKVFSGNSDQTSVVKHTLSPPIIARYIRLTVTNYSGWPSLRMEYYGCG